MQWTDFSLRLLAAVVSGGLIGLERQWRQRMTGLRTNALVAMGAAMFVMAGVLVPGVDSQGRIASYIVSGIGFLGGGVILKDGFNIRGLNTAATLWCTAAVGVLAGLGHPVLAAVGTCAVLAANLLLRFAAQLINRTPVESESAEIVYQFRCTCRTADEARVRMLLLEGVSRTSLALTALQSRDLEGADRVDVTAFLRSTGRKDEHLEQLVSRLSVEVGVTRIRWEVVSAVDMEEGPVGEPEAVGRQAAS